MDKRSFLGECLGTFILTLFGCSSVACAVLFGEYGSIFQIGLVWGLAVTLAVYMTRYLSCAHLNPAVSVAMVLAGRMKAKKLPCYLAAQLLGALVAGLVLYGLFSASIAHYEQLHNIVRGTAASVDTARMFGEFYPNPGDPVAVVSMPLAIAAEAFGTFLLVLIIFCLTEGCNVGRPSEPLQPLSESRPRFRSARGGVFLRVGTSGSAGCSRRLVLGLHAGAACRWRAGRRILPFCSGSNVGGQEQRGQLLL